MGRRAVPAQLFALSLAVAFLVLARPAPALAQDATPGPEGVASELLFETSLDAFPSAPVPAALARITFDLGAGLSMTANPGPALHFVEEGGFTVLAAAPMTLLRAATAGTPTSPASVSVGTEFTIGPGDLLVIPENAPFEVFNTGTEPAVALIIEFFGRDPGAALPPGIALAPLVVGEAETSPPPPVTVGLSRLTLAPGAETSPSPSDTTTLAYVETGTVGYTVEEGEGQVSTAATPGAAPMDPSLATPGAEASVEAGASFVTQAGTVSTLRNAGDDPLVLLTLVLSPANSGLGTPAAATSAP